VRVAVVVAEQVDTRCDVSHHVVLETYVLDDAPCTAAVRVARREHDCVSGLRVLPVVLEDVVLDDHSSRAFFNSNRFLTVHVVPGEVGTAPAVPAAPCP
jgi:hypothetical protein